MERLLEEISYDAPKYGGRTIEIDGAYVDERLKDLSQSEDLARYVL
jgi:ATP-dependent HslUV protease ATP-binding subunit HslU